MQTTLGGSYNSFSSSYEGNRFVKFGKELNAISKDLSPLLYLYLKGGSNTIVDSSFKQTPITQTNVTLSSSKIKNWSNSYYFAGNSRITCNIPFANNDYIIRFWVNFSRFSPTDSLFEMGTYSSGIWVIPNSNTNLQVYFGSPSYNSTLLALSINTWYYFEYSRKGNAHYIYLNGVLIHNQTLATVAPNTINIGGSNYSGTAYFKGYIDDLQIIIGGSIDPLDYIYKPYTEKVPIGLQYNSTIPSQYINKRPRYNTLGVGDIPNWNVSYQKPKSRSLVDYVEGYTYYKVDYTWILSEIQLSLDGSTNLVLSTANGVTFTRLSGVPLYDVGFLNDGLLGGSNAAYIGNTSSVESSYRIILPAKSLVKKLVVSPQGSGAAVFNNPTMLRISYSTNQGSSWTLIQEWTGLTAGSFTGNVLTSFTITNSY